MATSKATQRLQEIVSNRKNGGISGINTPNISSPSVNLNSYSNKTSYPGLSEQNYRKLEEEVDRLGLKGQARKEAMDQMYQRQIKDFINEQLLDKRADAINEQAYKAAEVKNEQADAQLRMTQFSQALKRKYKLDATANDLDVCSDFVEGLGEEGVNLAGQYLSGENKKLRYDAGLETFGEKIVDFAAGVMQSPGKRGYNLVGQRADKAGKRGAEKILGKELEDAYDNGREATDITKVLVGDERADSTATKVGEVVGDIGSAIALTAPLGAATAPVMANSTVGGAALLGGMEGALDTAVTHYGSKGDLDVKPGELALGTALGSVGGVLTNKLAQAGKEAVKNTADNVDDAAKISTKIADKTDDANRIAGRIGQGDIDDQAKVVEGVRSMTKRTGAKGVKAIKKYDELKNAIKTTEKQIVSQEDDLLRQFPDKITDWTTTETVRGLGDQVDDVTRDYLDDGIELLKKYNKNDPVAMRELEMLQNTKNTEGLTRLEAKELARKLGAKLSKKFYNSNDELRNSMSAESYEQIRKGIQNAVRDRLPNDALKNLDIEYSNLKAFEGLTDDMAEKVNTLTQKIKATGPIEKLGRKVGGVINRVTGKGVKGLVEKFLPSNMGNKINNSIDMEIELSKNLGKLVKLNDAIDTLNTTLNNPASQSALKTALKSFANTVTEIQASITPTAMNAVTRGAEATANLMYNDELDK